MASLFTPGFPIVKDFSNHTPVRDYVKI